MTIRPPTSAWRHARAAGRAAGDRDGGRRGRWRVAFAMVGFGSLYAVLGDAARSARRRRGRRHAGRGAPAAGAASQARPDIVDRNGEMLATDIKTASLFAEPRNIIDPDEATELLAARASRSRPRSCSASVLSSNAGFAYIKREITPRQQQAIHKLGIPGIGFRVENRRFYPGGPTASHVLGTVNIDNQGIAGIEKYIDASFLERPACGRLRDAAQALEPVTLSIDLRVQHVVRDELAQAMERYHAIAAIGIVLDVNTGEVSAMSSLPDYDPNNRDEALDKDKMNRVDGRRLRDGLDLQGLHDGHGARFRAGADHRFLRRDRRGSRSGSFTHQRLPRQAPLADRAGDLHLLLQRRHGARWRWRSACRASRRLPADASAFSTRCRPKLPEAGAPIVPEDAWSQDLHR